MEALNLFLVKDLDLVGLVLPGNCLLSLCAYRFTPTKVGKVCESENLFTPLLTLLGLFVCFLPPVPYKYSSTVSEELSPPSHQAKKKIRFLELQRIASSSSENKYVLGLFLAWCLHSHAVSPWILEAKLLASPLYH